MASKKKDHESGGFKLDAEDATVERLNIEGAADIKAKRSKVRDIDAVKSTAPQRWRSIGGVVAIAAGSILVACGRNSAPTSLSVHAMGTTWSLLTTVPGIAIAFIGLIVLALPSRRV